MLDPAQNAILQQLLDRQEILDVVQRYNRGIDRLDKELAYSAFHSDALDDHGRFVGSPFDVIDFSNAGRPGNYTATMHCVTNHYADLDGGTAHTETYCLVLMVRKDGVTTLGGARYIDRFEKRGGRWAIAARVNVAEAMGTLGAETRSAYAAWNFVAGRWDRDDVSYQRPLRIDPERLAAAAGSVQDRANSTTGEKHDR